MEQLFLTAENRYADLTAYIQKNQMKRIFLVCGNSLPLLPIFPYLKELEKSGIYFVRFSNFQSNPHYSSVTNGATVFHYGRCDSIIAIGGGSAIDVAKCIKLYFCRLNQSAISNEIKLVAIPTTAGTGSESTRFAVIYENGEKQSISDESCLPSAVLLDPTNLTTLPDYPRKTSMLDALCHAIEAFWSVNSTEESRKYSHSAIKLILSSMEFYLANQPDGNAIMLRAANLAGRAINIAQTTAGHAMCYKLTSLYGISHGHAAALCVRKLWPFMIENISQCTDERGAAYLMEIFSEIAEAMGCSSPIEAAEKFQTIFDSLGLSFPEYT